MILDSEQQRKVLMAVISNTMISGNIVEVERTSMELRRLLEAVKAATVSVVTTKKTKGGVK